MTKEFLEKTKSRLLEDKTRLEQDLADLGGKQNSQQHPGHFTIEYPESGSSSEDDNATEISEYADGLSIGSKLEAELRDVNKALAAITKGVYGICKYCEKEIDLKRLEARPTSSACISCKKLLTQEL
jgi:RNA polymerase-binding transcription factor DksA